MTDIGSIDTDAIGKDYGRIRRLASFYPNFHGVARSDMLSFGREFSQHDIARFYYRALAGQDPHGFLQTAGFHLRGGQKVSDAFRALLHEFRLNINAEAKSELFVPAFAKVLKETRGASLNDDATLRAAIEAGLGAIAPPGQALDTLLYRHFRNPNMAKLPEAPKTNDPAALEQHRKALEAHKKRSSEILEEKANKDPALRKKLDEVKAFEKNQRDIIASPQAGQPSRLMVIQPDGTLRRGVNPGRRTVEEIQRDLRGLPPTPR